MFFLTNTSNKRVNNVGTYTSMHSVSDRMSAKDCLCFDFGYQHRNMTAVLMPYYSVTSITANRTATLQLNEFIFGGIYVYVE